MATTVVLLALAWTNRAGILRNLGEMLVVDQRIESPQYVWIDASDVDESFRIAAACHHRCGARILLIPPDHDRLIEVGVKASPKQLLLRELAEERVGPDAIEVVPREQGIMPEDCDFARWMRRHPQAEVLVLCRRLRSANMRYLLDLLLRKLDTSQPCEAATGSRQQTDSPPFCANDLSDRVHVRGLADPRYDETNWWQIRFGAKEFFYGWVGLAFTWMYGPYQANERTLTIDEYDQRILEDWRDRTP